MANGIHGVSVESAGGITIITVRGALKLGDPSLDELRRRCCELPARGINKVVLDLGAVPVIDSAAIGILMQAYTSLHGKGGSCKLLNLQRIPAEVLRTVGVLRVFEVYGDRGAALDSFDRVA